MKNIFEEILANYQLERTKQFGGNNLATKFRQDYPELIKSLIEDKERYKVIGSPGKGNWADAPWIAILDKLVTDSPQTGYYPVYIFKPDMTGVYLSMNQGVTSISEYYKRDAKKVLRLRAEDYRAKLEYNEALFNHEISLNSNNKNSKLYEAGNIVSKLYSKDGLTDSQTLHQDLRTFLILYDQLTYSDSTLTENNSNTGFENKKIRLHWRIERSTSLSKKVKKLKGYKCEVCDLTFKEMYGDLGNHFIEAHHLTPISELDMGKFIIDIKNDFAVLCSNCHSMIHKMKDPSDLNGLREIVKKAREISR